MIVIAIIGILAAIALPAYQTYTNKAKFSEVILATSPYKTAMEIAVQARGATLLASLNDSELGIPAPIAAGSSVGQYVGTVTVATGVITATSTGLGAVDSTYLLNAEIINGGIRWEIDLAATCLVNGLC